MSNTVSQNNAISLIDSGDVKLTRGMKLEDTKNDVVINCIFKFYDKDCNGVLEEQEYLDYEKYIANLRERAEKLQKLRENNNTKVLEYYHEQIRKLEKQSEELNNKYKEFSEKENEFYKLGEYLKENNIEIKVCPEGTEAPEGVKLYCISNFKIGKDEKTGKNFEKGYIVWPENITDEKKKECEKLLKKSLAYVLQLANLENKNFKLNKDLDKRLALMDCAQAGLIDKPLTEEEEDQVYSQYCNIRTTANPFYNKIKTLEVEYIKALANKDSEKAEQIQIQKYQLEEASRAWSISSVENPEIKVDKRGRGVVTMSNSTTASQKSISDSMSASASIKNAFMEINGNITGNTTLNPEENFSEFDGNLTLDGSYKTSGGVNLKAGYNLSSNAINTTQTPSLGIDYSGFCLNTSYSMSETKAKMPNASGQMEETVIETNTTKLNLSKQIGKFSNEASVTIIDSENDDEKTARYSASTSATFNQQVKKVSINATPKFGISYNDNAKTISLNPDLNAGINYEGKNFSAGLNLNDNLSATTKFKDSSSTQNVSKDDNFNFNNTFTASGEVKFKLSDNKDEASENNNQYIKLNGNFTNTNSNGDKTNTYGLKVAYGFNNGGDISLGYDYTQPVKENGFNKENGRLTFGLNLPIKPKKKEPIAMETL